MRVASGEVVTGKIRMSLTRFIFTDFSTTNSPSASSLHRERIFYMGVSRFISRNRVEVDVGGQSDFPASALFSSLRHSICQVSIFWGSMS